MTSAVAAGARRAGAKPLAKTCRQARARQDHELLNAHDPQLFEIVERLGVQAQSRDRQIGQHLGHAPCGAITSRLAEIARSSCARSSCSAAIGDKCPQWANAQAAPTLSATANRA